MYTHVYTYGVWITEALRRLRQGCVRDKERADFGLRRVTAEVADSRHSANIVPLYLIT